MKLTPEKKKELIAFVRARVDFIRRGDRGGLDGTYSPQCLQRRNRFNEHDYRRYLDLIETEFGGEIARIDIEPAELSALPLAGQVTWPWQPEFKVYVQTTNQRRTLWLVRFFEDGPRVVLPAFGGDVFGRIATGEWALPLPADQAEAAAVVLQFHRESFVNDVAESVYWILRSWQYTLKFETIRAIALCCAPWFSGGCSVAILTTREHPGVEEFGKWNTGEWRYSEVSELPLALMQLIDRYYKGETDTDRELEPVQRAAIVFQSLADALLSDRVKETLDWFDLADDFEFGVFDPDGTYSGNYCDRK